MNEVGRFELLRGKFPPHRQLRPRALLCSRLLLLFKKGERQNTHHISACLGHPPGPALGGNGHLFPLESHRKDRLWTTPIPLSCHWIGEAFGPVERQGGLQGHESNWKALGNDPERKGETQGGRGCTDKCEGSEAGRGQEKGDCWLRAL